MKYTWLTVGALAVTAAGLCTVLVKRNVQEVKKTRSAHICNGIRENAAAFEGLYEGLFQASQNHAAFYTDAYAEWCDRVRHMDCTEFRTAFAQEFSKEDIDDEKRCRRKYTQLLACIEQAGIRRMHESGKSYTADESMQRMYSLLDSKGSVDGMELGADYTVVASAWTIGQKVIERGMVIRTIQDEGANNYV